MELLVAMWTVRLAGIAAVAVLAASLSAHASIPDAVLRAALAAFAFTFAGRQLLDRLGPPRRAASPAATTPAADRPDATASGRRPA